MTTRDTDTVGVSVSESPDLGPLGLSDGHLRDAMAEIALQVLASGRSLAYGGDLRHRGFTELLAELVGRYRDHPQHGGTIVVTDYLAWPVHIGMTPDQIARFSDEHRRGARLVFLALDGERLAREQRLMLCAHEPNEEEWTAGLTAMRTAMRRDIQARIVLGGRVEDYRGAIPGIAEEAHLSIEAGQPLFLVGGFGGCTRDIAEAIGLAERWVGSRGAWRGRERFDGRYSWEHLNNGLTEDENRVLARTPHIQEAVGLISRGLRRVLANGDCDAQGVH